MSKAKTLPAGVLKILNERLKDEYYAFYLYKSIGNWCKNHGFDKAAEYFSAESSDELSHAKMIEDFIVLWNGTPNLPAISKPILEFESLAQIIDTAYDVEYELYEMYEKDSKDIFEMGDICTFDFLKFFREVQTKSVGEYADMKNILEGVDTSSKFEMLLLEKKLF